MDATRLQGMCSHAFCNHLRKLKEKRKEQLEEKIKTSEESLKKGHYVVGTENRPYYTCKFCFGEIRNTYIKYLSHSAVCPKKKKR